MARGAEERPDPSRMVLGGGWAVSSDGEDGMFYQLCVLCHRTRQHSSSGSGSEPFVSGSARRTKKCGLRGGGGGLRRRRRQQRRLWAGGGQQILSSQAEAWGGRAVERVGGDATDEQHLWAGGAPSEHDLL